MGRLIDADKLLQQIKFDYDLDYGETLIDPRDFADAVCNSPTVDSVPVVRRRDCIAFEEIGKHPTNNGGTPFGYCYHWQYEQGMSPNEVDGNGFAATEKGENRMKITLDIPDGMVCGFLYGVVETRSGLTMVTYALDSHDLHNGAEIKLPREELKNGSV